MRRFDLLHFFLFVIHARLPRKKTAWIMDFKVFHNKKRIHLCLDLEIPDYQTFYISIYRVYGHYYRKV